MRQVNIANETHNIIRREYVLVDVVSMEGGEKRLKVYYC